MLLLPPLVEVKTAFFPRLSAIERRGVLARDTEKYFTLADRSLVVDAVPSIRSAASGALWPHALVAAPAQLVEAVTDAVTEAGLTLESVSVSTLCLADAVNARLRSSGTAIVVCAYDDRWEITIVTNGTIMELRRLPRECHDETLIASIKRLADDNASGKRAAHVFMVGDATYSIVAVANVDVKSLGRIPGSLRRADVAAACLVQRRLGPSVELLPPALSEQRQKARWRLAVRNVAASACILMAALGYRAYRVRHQLELERIRRGRLVADRIESLRLKDTLLVLQREWLLVAYSQSGPLTRAPALASIARVLPDDATLTSIRLRGDTVFMTGSATSAEEVLVALQDSHAFSGSRFTSPIEQVVQTSDSTEEHFSIRSIFRIDPASLLDNRLRRPAGQASLENDIGLPSRDAHRCRWHCSDPRCRSHTWGGHSSAEIVRRFPRDARARARSAPA